MIPPVRLGRCLLIGWLLAALAPPLPAETRLGAPFILLDLENDGFYLTEVVYAVLFDVDDDGVRERTAWTAAGRREAFLWIDRDANDRVDGGGELIRSFAELARLDGVERGGNGDGMLSAADPAWQALDVWVDADHDGRSGARETASLAESGIVEIALAFRRVYLLDGSANVIRAIGQFRGGGEEPRSGATEGRLAEISFVQSEVN